MKVLCFESLNMDYTCKVNHFIKKGETLSSDSRQVFRGGKGLNQSVASSFFRIGDFLMAGRGKTAKIHTNFKIQNGQSA